MILSIDVGKGTEDILVLHEKNSIENSIQLVLPSMAQLLAAKMQEENAKIIFIDGYTVAGEPWHKEIYRLAKSSDVYMTIDAARSLKYNISRVVAKRINILQRNDFYRVIDDLKLEFSGIEKSFYTKLTDNISFYYLNDINWPRIINTLISSNISISDISTVLICCQDHGEPEDNKRSVRDFRIEEIYGKLSVNGKIEDLMQRGDKISDKLPRHQSIVKSATKYLDNQGLNSIYLMDSSPAVILGAMIEYKQQNKDINRRIFINLGNGHTLITYIDNDMVMIIYEIHTSGIDINTLDENIRKLLSGELTHEIVLAQGGHGVFINKKFKSLDNISIASVLEMPYLVIGPNRNKISVLNVEFIHPAGNMMMAGPLGLIYAYNSKN